MQVACFPFTPSHVFFSASRSLSSPDPGSDTRGDVRVPNELRDVTPHGSLNYNAFSTYNGYDSGGEIFWCERRKVERKKNEGKEKGQDSEGTNPLCSINHYRVVVKEVQDGSFRH